MELGVDLEIDFNHRLFPVLLAPVAMHVHVSHDPTLLVSSVYLLYVQIVQLHQVLLHFRFAQEWIYSEADPLFTVYFRRPQKLDLVVHEFDFLLWFAEVAGNGRLESLGVHITFVFKLLLIVAVQLFDVI